MVQIICNAKLTQLIDKLTRTTFHPATLIDIIITIKYDLAFCHDVFPCPVGDHDLITDITKPKGQSTIKSFRRLRDYSFDMLCSLLIT